MQTNEITNTFYKTTILIESPTPRERLNQKQQQQLTLMENKLKIAWEFLKDYEHNCKEHYYEFKIPKRSGGLRTINAPNEDFKAALSQVKTIFEQDLKCLAHDCAYAYTKTRSTLDALKKHQTNKSNWYLKIDLTDFFPSCTPKIIYKQLKQLYPFFYFSEKYDKILMKIIQTCCLNNGLPQGTPMSPLLTNLLMIPYDYTINNFLKRGTGEHYVYTRYADDILISSKNTFNWKNLESELKKLLAPFQIKSTKTRYGSKAGRNWNLGLMLNKDNNITLGSAKKKQLNAMLNNFLKDAKNNVYWSKEDVQYLQGNLSYLQQIEPDYYTYIVNKYQTKYRVFDYRNLIKRILN
jgi:hypothetical protein